MQSPRMNKPVEISPVQTETPVPMALVPKPQPAPSVASRIRKSGLIGSLLSLAALAAVGVVWWLSSAGGTVQYTTAAVTRGAIIRAVTATGTVNPVLTIIVGTYVSGVIQELSCDYNTQVKTGQICAKIDPRPYQTVVDQTKANLTAAKAQVDTNVSESDIGSTKEGYKALFTVDAYPKRTFNGVVTQVRQSPQTVQNVVTYDVVVSVDNTDLALKPGMTAATRVISDQRDNALRVPSQVLRYTPNGVRAAGGAAEQARVWALRDGKPVTIPIVAGLDDDSFVEIVKGDLKPDDRVVVSEQRVAAPSRGRGTLL